MTADLGFDLTGERFRLISDRMVKGHFYPSDAVQYFSEAQDEGRDLRPGDRVLQFAPFLPFLDGFGVWQTVEIFAADRNENSATLGYVTTAKHHGRGIWKAVLSRDNNMLSMTITSTTCPNSWLFWMGLPLARYLQLRARRRAIEGFQQLGAESSPI